MREAAADGGDDGISPSEQSFTSAKEDCGNGASPQEVDLAREVVRRTVVDGDVVGRL